MSTTTETRTTAPQDTEPGVTQNVPEPAPSTDPEPQHEPREDEQREAGPNGEAAKYRRALRAVEAERDGLREQLTAARRREVDRLAELLLAQVDDLFTIGGVQLDDLVDVDGQIDEQAVLAAATALLDTRPGLGRVERRTSPPNHGAGYRPPARSSEPTWGEAFNGE
ncbi:hypothetical protein [Kineococcus sp. SYSU DK001]|uniref:hypothetical protein n=1 Tax=Kineococcus sp. SYSU DK001 TaxID=3383122 RepID=UPI003D7EC59D